MGANNSTAAKCSKSYNKKVIKSISSVDTVPNSESCDPPIFIHSSVNQDQEIKAENEELIKCRANSNEIQHKDAEIIDNQDMLMEQFKLMEEHYKLIEHENLVKEKLEHEKMAFEIEKKKQQTERDNRERILQEKELELAEKSALIQIHSKQIEKREAEVDSLLKSVVSFDIERHLRTHRPIKPFDHHVKLQEGNIENGSGVIRKILQTPQPIRRNQSFREFRSQNREKAKQNSMLSQQQGEIDIKAKEYPPSLLSIEIPQHIKEEATKLNVSKRCGKRSTKKDVNQSRRNTWNCGRNYQLFNDPEQNRGQIMNRTYKCPECKRVWTSPISYTDTNQKCENCVTILPTQKIAKKCAKRYFFSKKIEYQHFGEEKRTVENKCHKKRDSHIERPPA